LRPDPRRLQGLGLAFAAHHIDVDLPAAPDQRVDDGAEHDAPPQGPAGLADDDLADVPMPRIGVDLVAYRGAGERDGLRAELLGEPERLDDAITRGLGQADAGGRLDVGDDPLGAHARGEAPAGAHELRGERARADADQDALAHGPGP